MDLVKGMNSMIFTLGIMVTIFVKTGESKMVDMTHVLNKDARHFQAFRSFELTYAVNASFGTLGNMW